MYFDMWYDSLPISLTIGRPGGTQKGVLQVSGDL